MKNNNLDKKMLVEVAKKKQNQRETIYKQQFKYMYEGYCRHGKVYKLKDLHVKLWHFSKPK